MKHDKAEHERGEGGQQKTMQNYQEKRADKEPGITAQVTRNQLSSRDGKEREREHGCQKRDTT